MAVSNPMLRLVATPVFADGLLVVPSAKRGPVYALEVEGAAGDVTGSQKHTRWRLERGTPDVPSPLVQGGLVYLGDENGRLTSIDAKTGEEVYAARVHGGPHRGSPLYADGKVFLVATDGTVSVVRAGRKYELLAKNDVDAAIDNFRKALEVRPQLAATHRNLARALDKKGLADEAERHRRKARRIEARSKRE